MLVGRSKLYRGNARLTRKSGGVVGVPFRRDVAHGLRCWALASDAATTARTVSRVARKKPERIIVLQFALGVRIQSPRSALHDVSHDISSDVLIVGNLQRQRRIKETCVRQPITSTYVALGFSFTLDAVRFRGLDDR